MDETHGMKMKLMQNLMNDLLKYPIAKHGAKPGEPVEGHMEVVAEAKPKGAPGVMGALPDGDGDEDDIKLGKDAGLDDDHPISERQNKMLHSKFSMRK